MTVRVLEYVRDPAGVWELPASEVDRLRRAFPNVRFDSPRDREQANALLPEADAVLGWAVTPQNFVSARRLRWIHVFAAGVGSALFPELARSEVTLTNGRGLHAIAMAEHTLGVLLAFVRQLHLARDAQHERRWAQQELMRTSAGFRDLAGTTLGLVGFGHVGHAIAERVSALGVRVIAVRRHPAQPAAPAEEQWGIDRLDELCERADWLVLAAALTPDSRHLIDARRMARMRAGAVLINLGRGGLVDEPALIAALESGRLAGAALDVVAEEPLNDSNPLWRMPQVILTPHISGLGPNYWERAVDMYAGNLRAFLRHEPLMNVVDKDAGY